MNHAFKHLIHQFWVSRPQVCFLAQCTKLFHGYLRGESVAAITCTVQPEQVIAQLLDWLEWHGLDPRRAWDPPHRPPRESQWGNGDRWSNQHTLRVFRDPSTGLLPVPFCWRRRQEAALEPSPDSTESVWQRSLESWCNCVKFGQLSKTRNLYLKNCSCQDFPRFIIIFFFFYFLKVQSCGQKNQVRNE